MIDTFSLSPGVVSKAVPFFEIAVVFVMDMMAAVAFAGNKQDGECVASEA